MNLLFIAASLSDAALLDRVKQLAATSRAVTVELIAALAELDVRKHYRGEGPGSLFAYCTQVLRLSEAAAGNRIKVARAARKFPVILDLLATGAVNLTTVRLLAPHLTAENHAAILEEATGMTRRKVDKLVARLAPKRDVGEYVRSVPEPKTADQAQRMLVSAEEAASGADPCETTGARRSIPVEAATALPIGTGMPTLVAAGGSPGPNEPTAPLLPPTAVAAGSPPAAPPPRDRGDVTALSPGRFRVRFMMDTETEEQLRRLQDLLCREVPDGSIGEIFARGIGLLLREVEKKKLAATASPRPSRTAPPAGRHIPAEVARGAWKRDGARCAYVAESGHRCTERRYLELHHAGTPYALGGDATLANIALRCRGHNVFEAELLFGPYEPSRARETSPTYGSVEGFAPRRQDPERPGM